jgi:hypothetical protein
MRVWIEVRMTMKENKTKWKKPEKSGKMSYQKCLLYVA